ncbi:MAG: type II secretion system protein [Bacilli bacterium]|nr:type II secretion system protein [Bacilli bacterium]
MKKGFTLIELLAVIVILALIALISVPMILGIVEKVKKGALGATANGLLESATLYYAKNLSTIGENKVFLFDETHEGETTDNIKLTYKGDFKGTGSVRIYKDGKTAICIQDEKYYAIKNINNTKVTTGTGTCSYDEATNTYLSVNLVSQELVDNLQEQLDNLTDEISNLKSLGNATASDILSGKTAVVNGELVTGTMSDIDSSYIIQVLRVQTDGYAYNYLIKFYLNDKKKLKFVPQRGGTWNTMYVNCYTDNTFSTVAKTITVEGRMDSGAEYSVDISGYEYVEINMPLYRDTAYISNIKWE